MEGIRSITDADIEAATKNGYVIKLVATATQAGGKIETRVAPSLVPVSHPLASLGGSFNAVVIEAESADRLMFYGRGAGGAPTASVAGLLQAGEQGKVPSGAKIVCTVTGNGLKDTATALGDMELDFDPIEPTTQAAARVLGLS